MSQERLLIWSLICFVTALGIGLAVLFAFGNSVETRVAVFVIAVFGCLPLSIAWVREMVAWKQIGS